MARLRTIKPGFFTDDDLGELPPLARLLYAGMWCHADREGRQEDRPRRMKVEILPYDDCDIDQLLGLLAERECITRYEANGRRYVQIKSFLRHQQPHYKETASIIPPPPGHVDSQIVTTGVPEEQRARIFARDGHECVECGSTERLTIDHITARSRGGSGGDENLQTLCLRCNAAKGNREAKATSGGDAGNVGSTSVQRRFNVGATESPVDTGLLSSVLGDLTLDSCLGSGNPTPAAPSPASAKVQGTALALVVAVPDAVRPLAEVLNGLPGYEPNAAFFEKVAAKYGGLDLGEEAIKMRDWLARHAKKRCSHGFILNWLKAAEAEGQQAAITPFRPRQPAASMADVAAAFIRATDEPAEAEDEERDDAA